MSLGWEDRRKAYMRVRRGWAMDIWQAQPWQEDGHLHVGNAEWLLSAYAHFHWELPAALIPRRHCPGDCKDKSPADPPCLDSPKAQAMARRHAAMKVDHCIESCPLNGGVRTNVHDNLQALWVVMLKAASRVCGWRIVRGTPRRRGPTRTAAGRTSFASGAASAT